MRYAVYDHKRRLMWCLTTYVKIKGQICQLIAKKEMEKKSIKDAKVGSLRNLKSMKPKQLVGLSTTNNSQCSAHLYCMNTLIDIYPVTYEGGSIAQI